MRSPKWINRRRKERQKEAARRQRKRDSRSDEEQLRRLIARGHGHCAEAERLRERIAEQSPSPKETH